MLQVLIAVPLSEEMKYAYDFLKQNGGQCSLNFHSDEMRYAFTWILSSRTSILIELCLIGEMGNLSTATRMVAAYDEVQPSVTFLLGIAGSLSADVHLGDVAVATRVKSIFPDKIKKLDAAIEVFGDPKTPTPPYITVDPRKRIMQGSFMRFRRTAISATSSAASASHYFNYLDNTKKRLPLESAANIPGLEARLENPQPTIFQTVILGSDVVIDSDEYVAFLADRNPDMSDDYYTQKGDAVEAAKRNQWRDDELKVVDMESLGFFTFASRFAGNEGSDKRFFSVRGISDFSTEKKKLPDKVREIAVRNALRVVIDMIEFFDNQNPRRR